MWFRTNGAMMKYPFTETKMPAKCGELIGPAGASSIKCPYCIHFRTRAAKMNGTIDEEIAETAFLNRFSSLGISLLSSQNYQPSGGAHAFFYASPTAREADSFVL